MVGVEVADGLVEADHPLLHDVLAVGADEEVRAGLDPGERRGTGRAASLSASSSPDAGQRHELGVRAGVASRPQDVLDADLAVELQDEVLGLVEVLGERLVGGPRRGRQGVRADDDQLEPRQPTSCSAGGRGDLGQVSTAKAPSTDRRAQGSLCDAPARRPFHRRVRQSASQRADRREVTHVERDTSPSVDSGTPDQASAGAAGDLGERDRGRDPGVERLGAAGHRDRTRSGRRSPAPAGPAPRPRSRRRSPAGRSRARGRRGRSHRRRPGPTANSPASRYAPSACGPGWCSGPPAAGRPRRREVRQAAAVMPAARRSGTSTPCAPKAAAERTTAPRLRGSVTPSSATISGGVGRSSARREQVVGVQVGVRRDLQRDALVQRTAGHLVHLLAGSISSSGDPGLAGDRQRPR